MKKIWTYINNKKWSVDKKMRTFLLLTTLTYSLIGFALWFALHFFALNTYSWAVCFIGYPGVFIGMIGSILYLFNHDF